MTEDGVGGLLQRRLLHQRLTGARLPSPEATVRHLVAVQSQDYAAAKWSLALRADTTTDSAVETAIDRGAVLRTHVLRPTWHFVLPEDIRWLLELTAPRIRRTLAHYDHQLELTDEVLSASKKVMTAAVEGGRYRTRAELAALLEFAGVPARGQRLAHILMHAELDALICSGPRRGAQFTYALLEERAPAARRLSRDDGLAELAIRYFAGHGPAQLKDFAWWSGLSAREAGTGLGSVASRLERAVVDGKEYWSAPDAPPWRPDPPRAFLLSAYDEYVVAYTDRSLLSSDPGVQRLRFMGAPLSSVAVLDGRVAGLWKKTSARSALEVRLRAFARQEPGDAQAYEAAVRAYGVFAGAPVTLVLEDI